MNPLQRGLAHRQSAIPARPGYKPEPDAQPRRPAKRRIEDQPPAISQLATTRALPTILSSDQQRHIVQPIVIPFRQNHGNHPPHLLFASSHSSPHSAPSPVSRKTPLAPRRRRHRS